MTPLHHPCSCIFCSLHITPSDQACGANSWLYYTPCVWHSTPCWTFLLPVPPDLRHWFVRTIPESVAAVVNISVHYLTTKSITLWFTKAVSSDVSFSRNLSIRWVPRPLQNSSLVSANNLGFNSIAGSYWLHVMVSSKLTGNGCEHHSAWDQRV
jgi:hypothetical protein